MSWLTNDPTEKLSESGQRIKQLVDEGKTLAAIVREHPDLIDALDEYTKYETHQAIIDGRMNAKSAITHPIAEQAKKLAGKQH